ncbi:GNAT family N-acetyltransferase [Streptomyces spectabilis]|uniref:GNAT family N-acetyltransferase n=1 Tax=Streptomyces spectabilis TaxID=68270 RepID=A0A5P2WZZ9_STRST|nr:GNAT family N-acetyltransferase [Streptomyces spectabilis]MBB5107460.1 GNAT superfamily N-acetyltransferase [Streptomyces spectabilis]MCI3900148.1 GNAT family N-acetyltransferase [Streptomyces spectabilis]QEV57761.1 GNAT family N-acetyltransferase [Streptomyces spectabilis]GGV37776.1 N-acetyltransferase [Streptomyces spectabilis]
MQVTTIRRAVGRDAEPLTALVQGSSAYRGRYAPMISGYRVTGDYIARHEVFAAVGPASRTASGATGGATGQLLGFYALILDPPELDLMFVADAAQGLGVGRLLVEHMKGRAAEAGVTDVRVVSHPPAERFYRRLGAEPVGTVAPLPPKVTWERPELRFAIAR